MKVIWSSLSVERTTEIGKYIALDDRPVATKWIESVFNRVEQLESFPKGGTIVSETNREDIHQLTFDNYRVYPKICVNGIINQSSYLQKV